MMTRRLAAALAVLAAPVLAVPPSLGAQRNQLSIEANPFRGTLGYARAVAPRWHVGGEVGFGFPQLDHTLAPDEGDFLDILHVGPVARYSPSPRVSMDVGARVGVADLHECRASDCWPGLYGAASAAVMVGWRSVQFGPRVVVGTIKEGGEPSTGFVSLSPLNVLVRFDW